MRLRGAIGEDLVARCHELDPTRPVTSGHSASEFMDVLGVNGSSEKMGWFDHLEKDRVFIGTENTHTWQVRGFYRIHDVVSRRLPEQEATTL